MITVAQRTERYKDLQRRGVSVPMLTAEQLAADLPPLGIRQHLWYAYLWEEPTQRDIDGLPLKLEPLVEQWQKSERFVTASLERRAAREAEEAQHQRDREAADIARRKQEADDIRNELRRQFLALPGTAESEFEAAYPALLADHRKRLLDAQAAEDERARLDMRESMRRAMSGA